MADDAALFDFYDQRMPADVTSARHFDTWWKKARAQTPDLLTFSPPTWPGPAAARSSPADYPARWGELPLSYEFAPGDAGGRGDRGHPAGRAGPGRAATSAGRCPGGGRNWSPS